MGDLFLRFVTVSGNGIKFETSDVSADSAPKSMVRTTDLESGVSFRVGVCSGDNRSIMVGCRNLCDFGVSVLDLW